MFTPLGSVANAVYPMIDQCSSNDEQLHLTGVLNL